MNISEYLHLKNAQLGNMIEVEVLKKGFTYI